MAHSAQPWAIGTHFGGRARGEAWVGLEGVLVTVLLASEEVLKRRLRLEEEEEELFVGEFLCLGIGCFLFAMVI